MTERRKRLIEVAFPLEEVSEHSAHETNVKFGHISMLHIWWARRPLAACRAFIYASLVNDPETDAERDELLKEVADVASWEALRRPDQVVRPKPKGSGLSGRELLRRARERILRDNDDRPPKLLDPFAGGGAIPLEALRLGCEVEASDLNPVAGLILKGTVAYPQKYGRPLAEQRSRRPDDCAGVNGHVPRYIRVLDEKGGSLSGLAGGLTQAYERNPLVTDVRYWGNWILEQARGDIGAFYPADPDGSVPVAYLWSRTIPCPSCRTEMPLVRQFSLARTGKRQVWLAPTATGEIDFDVREGPTPPDTTGSTSRGDAVCLRCRQVASASTVRRIAREGKMRAMLTAVVAEGPRGKIYRPDKPSDLEVIDAAAVRLAELAQRQDDGLPPVPDEPIDAKTLGLRVDGFGLTHWSDLYSKRQLLALSTLARLCEQARAAMVERGHSPEYSDAVVLYLAFAVDRFANTNSTLTRLMSAGGRGIVGTFARQALAMVWDYAEANPFGSSASWPSALEGVLSMFSVALAEPTADPAVVSVADARVGKATPGMNVFTDPPYYNAIDYAGLSDFFYVWLKRSLRNTEHAKSLSLPVTPKAGQAIMASESNDPSERSRYISIVAESFSQIGAIVRPNGFAGVVFAHSAADAWADLITSLLAAELVPDTSWPIDTELANKVGASERTNLKTSVWMMCRPRRVDAGTSFVDDIRVELRREVETNLLDFWRRGIRGADFFISAIGPALAVFGRHSKVLHPDGSEVSVREFLDIVRQESARVALQQVLHGENLGAIDPATRAYVMWVWSYGKASLDAGEAIAHCLATGADLGDITRPHAIAETAKDKSKKVVKLRSIAARAREDDELGRGNGARNTPLIDELQYAAYLWGAGKAASELPQYRASLGEERWKALRILGQAVAECLPDGDDDRRIILGLLGSGAASGAAATAVAGTQTKLEL